MQDLHGWNHQYRENRAHVSALLNNGSDLGELAMTESSRMDIVNDCLVDALRLHTEERSVAGRAVAQQLSQVSEHGKLLDNRIEAGRDRVIGALSRGLDAAQRQQQLEGSYAKQLNECSAFMSSAVDKAAQARDSVYKQRTENAAELAAIGSGISSARVELEGALKQSDQARSVNDQTENQVTVRIW